MLYKKVSCCSLCIAFNTMKNMKGIDNVILAKMQMLSGSFKQPVVKVEIDTIQPARSTLKKKGV